MAGSMAAPAKPFNSTAEETPRVYFTTSPAVVNGSTFPYRTQKRATPILRTPIPTRRGRAQSAPSETEIAEEPQISPSSSSRVRSDSFNGTASSRIILGSAEGRQPVDQDLENEIRAACGIPQSESSTPSPTPSNHQTEVHHSGNRRRVHFDTRGPATIPIMDPSQYQSSSAASDYDHQLQQFQSQLLFLQSQLDQANLAGAQYRKSKSKLHLQSRGCGC